VASERAFSIAGLADTLHRNRIDPFGFGQVQILRNAYTSNHLNAAEEADAYEAVELIEID
jgi:hypothetical protein